MEQIHKKKNCSTNIYVDRNDKYPIIGNRILCRANQPIRKYENKANLARL
jgi:hypothetical protein